MFYKGFRKPFPVVVKGCFHKVYKVFDSANSRSALLNKLMLFDAFGSLFRKWHPEVFINDKAYKGFPKPFSVFVKGCFTKVYKVFDSANARSVSLENLMLFDDGSLFRKRHPEVCINDRLFKGFRKPFSVSVKGCFHKVL